MPDIQLPDVSGVGTGMGKGVDGYELMPDMASLSIFGGSKSLATGNEFEGTFIHSLMIGKVMKVQ